MSKISFVGVQDLLQDLHKWKLVDVQDFAGFGCDFRLDSGDE